MSAWIGPLGNLIEFKCPSAVDSQSEDPHVYFRPLGGSVSSTVLGDPTRPRVWDVKVDAARPDQVAALQGMADGEWGPGPFVFIPPAAETLNLLGKRDAFAMGVAAGRYVNERPGTAIRTTDGITGTGYAITGTDMPPHMNMGTAPVIPGTPVTARAWVQALDGYGANIRMRFFSTGHALIGTSPMAATNSTTGVFLHTTTMPPEGAAYAILDGAGAVLTRPSITWTDGPRPWAPSAASSNVVMSSLSNSVRRATGTPGEAQITDHAFTVQELRA